MRSVTGARRLLVLAAALAALVAGCGGDEPVQTSTAAPPPDPTGSNAQTISPFDTLGTAAPGVETGSVAFPALDPQGVLALAAQRPDGRVRYEAVLDGTSQEIIITRLASRAAVTVTREGRTVRVGVNLDDASIRWTCVIEGVSTPRCRNRDFDNEGSNALAAAAILVGEDRLRQIVTRISGAADVTLEDRVRAQGVDASCLAGTVDGGNLLVCVSPSGFVTDTEEGPTRATAVEVTPDVNPADLEPPTAS